MATFIRSAVFGFSLSLALVAACGGDTDIETGDGTTDDAASEGDTSDDTSQDTSDDDGSSMEQNACGAGDVNADDECEVCIATKCTTEALACCQAPGCLDVVRCAAEKGCNGVDCYTPDNCQAEIDTAGIDVASNQASALGECAIAECTMECESAVGGG